MPISYPEVLELKREAMRFEWSRRDTMLYALGLGFGSDPMEEAELAFVYERGLKAVPSLATAVAFAKGPVDDLALDMALVVHADQKAVFHRPFPSEGAILCDMAITGAWDRGPRGAMLEIESRLRDEAGEPLATLTAALIARGDGGFGGPGEGAPQPHPAPERAPDLVLTFATRPEQALIYRLSGDYNPLHADPAAARAAGFDRPILHGLCSYGICCRAVLKAYAGYDSARIRSLDARFTAPVWPGETLAIELWRDGDVVSFQARTKERDVLVVRNGRSLLG